MSEIAKLYEDVMAGVEKTAADTSADNGSNFNANFFQKVAAGDEGAVEEVTEFIEEARAQGASDDQIEAAIDEAAAEAGYADGEVYGDPDDYEHQKMSAYDNGWGQAMNDVLASNMAKEAGITADDLIEYDMGGAYGEGYTDAREALDEAIEKIADGKKSAFREGLGKAWGAVKAAPGQYSRAMRGSGAGGWRGAAGMGKGWKRGAQVWGARGGTGLVAGGAGYAGKRAYDKRKGRR